MDWLQFGARTLVSVQIRELRTLGDDRSAAVARALECQTWAPSSALPWTAKAYVERLARDLAARATAAAEKPGE
jgi:hypothetical protein